MTWTDPLYPADRRIAIVGGVQIGAVFPPPIPGRTQWSYRMFVTTAGFPASGFASDEEAAKAAVAARFEFFLESAGLQRKEAP